MVDLPPDFVGSAIALFSIAASGYLLFVAFKNFEMFTGGKTRKAVKWKDQKPRIKVIGVLTLTSLAFELYLVTASLLTMSGTYLPLGGLFFDDSYEIPLVFGLLGLAYVLKVQNQVPKTNA